MITSEHGQYLSHQFVDSLEEIICCTVHAIQWITTRPFFFLWTRNELLNSNLSWKLDYISNSFSFFFHIAIVSWSTQLKLLVTLLLITRKISGSWVKLAVDFILSISRLHLNANYGISIDMLNVLQLQFKLWHRLRNYILDTGQKK
jgi:hypothetical protein